MLNIRIIAVIVIVVVAVIGYAVANQDLGSRVGINGVPPNSNVTHETKAGVFQQENPLLDPRVTYESILPPLDYDAKGYIGIGKQYPPEYVALKCLSYFSTLRNDTAKSYGMYVANWLIDHGKDYSHYLIFYNNFSWPIYDLKPGWVDGKGQGTAAECFMSAYDHSKDQKYLKVAKQSLYALRVPVAEGGVLIDEGDGKWWYEEYASKDSKRSYVLNGHQFTLLSLHKYLQYDNDTEVLELFDKGLKALKADAMLYVNGYNNSFYDRLGHPAVTYHKTHLINFQKLYDITGDKDFLMIEEAFENGTKTNALTSSGSTVAPTHPVLQNRITLETSNSGVKDYNFTLTPSHKPSIQAYASKTSVYPGETLDFYVNSTDNYKIRIYRLGWYANGAPVRLMYDDPNLHQAFKQPEPYYDPSTNFVDPRWNKSFSLKIPDDWVTGIYFAEFTTQKKGITYVLFIVKNTSNAGDIVMKISVNTYQAYNEWGGKSLYEGSSDNRILQLSSQNMKASSLYEDVSDNTTLHNPSNQIIKRALKVTFDRPYADEDGLGQFLRWDFPLVRFLERNGYDVSYITDVDLHENGKVLSGFKVFISSGHDEYWSYEMRKNLEDAKDKGLNIIFSSGNVMYWQIRYEDSFDGEKDRVIVCYRDKLLDPYYGKNNTLVTVLWRDNPVNLPENSLVGIISLPPWGVQGAFTVVNSSSWVYKGTGFRDGDKVPGIIGNEVQHFVVNGFEPKNVTLLGHSLAMNTANKTILADTILFSNKNGSLTFSSGSIQWNWGLDNWSYYEKNICGNDTCRDHRLEIMMKNIIERMIESK